MTRSRSAWIRTPAAVFWLVSGVALALRLIHVLQMSDPAVNPAFWHPAGDAGVHARWGRQLLAGAWPGAVPFFKAPLYPYLLGGLYALFGAQNPLPVQVVHAVISAFGAGFAGLAAGRLWSARAAWSAGLLLAVFWPSIFFAGELLAVSVTVTLNLLLLWLLLGPLPPRRVGLIGVVWGLSAISRPTVLVIAPVVVWYLWRRAAFGRPGRWAGWLWLLGGLIVTIGPVGVSNLVRSGEPVPIAASGGVNFYIGNNPYADGRVAFLPGAPLSWQGELAGVVALAASETGHPVTAITADRYFWRRGLAFWRDTPGAAARLLARKAWLLLAAGERANNKDLAFWRARSPLLRWPIWPGWALVLALAVLGFGRADLNPDARRLLLGLVGLYAAALLLFFINARFRLPLAAWLTVPAGGGLAALQTAWRHHNWSDLPRRAALAAVVVGAVSWLPDAATYRPDPVHDYQSWRNLGNSYHAVGDDHRAVAAWQEALGSDDFDPARANRWTLPQIYQSLAQVYQEAHDDRRALAIHRRWLARLPESTAAHLGLANQLLAAGQPEAAIRQLNWVLARDVDNQDARLGLAWALQRAGQAAAATTQFKRVLAHGDNPSAALGLGQSLLDLKEYAAAERTLLALRHDHPRFWPAYETLAAVYARTGRRAWEKEVWTALLRGQPGNREAQRRLAQLR